MKMLKTLAATDRVDSDRKFLDFITKQDFYSPYGRAVAEKNTFSLLSKRKYLSLAAFFLLAQPPLLKSAINIIVTKLEDLALEFLVCRLVESRPLHSNYGTNEVLIS